MSPAKDHELVLAAKAGDEDAFSQLVALYEKPIYHLTLRMCKKPEDAEEVTQTAFLNAWRGLPQFHEDASFFTWLYRLATNACIDFLRHEKRRRLGLPGFSLDEDSHPYWELPHHGMSPEEAALQKDLYRTLYAALEALSPEHREILLQREMEGLSYQEIADIAGLEMGTVKSRIARARLSLRQVLLESGNYFDRVPSENTKTKKGGLTP